jgi:Orthopoxvirus protein of unknown function (DUF830).
MFADGMKSKVLSVLLIVLLCAMTAGIFISGNFVMFILAYLFLFAIMLFRSLYAAETLNTRLLYIGVYTAVMIMQIVYTTLITFAYESDSQVFMLFKLTSAAIILVSPIIERLFFARNSREFFMPSAQDFAVVTYAQLVHDRDKIMEAANSAQKAGHAFSKENLSKVLEPLQQHSSFRYVNNGNLTDEYFKTAYDSLDDESIYIVLTDSGSPASELISVFTKKRFNHVSLSFDRNLETIVSYNGGEDVYMPGMNHEMVECFNKKADSSIMVYRLNAPKQQKQSMIEKIQQINREGSAYNLLGLVFKYSFKPNIMFCSQFVYKMLQHAGLAYFEKRSTDVKPTDLVELDYYRKLEFSFEIRLNQ